MHEFYRRITDSLQRGETVAHLKVIRVDGSGPQEVGASMLLRADGSFEGTIGGGAVEAAALKDAAAL
ncbi:MAG TPA: XdhC family protein, partial [Candidatus Krumholzibacteria bacterium]|nr:XdhC family protein [Candidatus Krumholzibacteria bacterium]